jgi:hypothetical protein
MLAEPLSASGAALWQAKKHMVLKSAFLDNRTLGSTPITIKKPQDLGRKYSALEKSVTRVAEAGVAVVVPGLGSLERASSVERNVEWLRKQGVPFECWIYVYRTEEELELDESRFKPCLIVRNAGFWLTHILAMPLHTTSMPWILHMEESSEPQSDVNLTVMFETMKANGLGHAAPTFDVEKTPNPHGCEPPCGCCGSLYPILACNKTNKIGRFVDFIELHFDVFTREYFACLQDNIAVSVYTDENENTAIGWGMDRILPALCGGSVSRPMLHAGRMGLMDHMTIEKRHHSSYDLLKAEEGQQRLLSKYPDVALPQYENLGELLPPPGWRK